ncbi:hypothetical protein HanIR_Chr17g0847471 [Helianthus annuus]|nr:hypothetical protein HanIR_Chr17g0847471 [Helianthus annuus]
MRKCSYCVPDFVTFVGRLVLTEMVILIDSPARGVRKKTDSGILETRLFILNPTLLG